jgi:hypothetical protein
MTEMPRDCRLAMRGVCRSWEAWHDGHCRTLKIPPGVDDGNFRAVFRRFSGLTELDISDSATLTGYGLWRLATVGLRSLTTLDLSGSYKEHRSQLDNGFEALSLGGFPALRSLKLAGCEVTDSVVKQISTISTLTELNIRQCVPLVLGLGPMSMRSRAPCPTWSIVLSSTSFGSASVPTRPAVTPVRSLGCH